MKVSVCITTYNKEDYIEQALDSIINQKTNFDFEILIYDDASSDATVSIIREYQKKHSNIRLYANSKNEYGNGLYGINERNLFPKAKGQYIAMCDGDDYWIDDFKLQKQVDFLDANLDYIMCCHDGKVYYQKSNVFGKVYEKPFQNPITYQNVIAMGGNLCPTSSIVFRNIIRKYPDFIYKAMSNDRALTYFLIKLGKFWFINEEMCVYRVHSQGLIAAGDKKVRLKYLKSNVDLLVSFREFTKDNYFLVKYINKELSKMVKNIYYFDSISKNRMYLKQITLKDFVKVCIYKLLTFFNIK